MPGPSRLRVASVRGVDADPAGGAVWARAPDVVVEEFEPEIVLFDRARRDLHRLNGPAAAVWRSLDGRATVAEVAGSLAAHVGAPADQVLRDTAGLLQQLAAAGLVVRVDP